MTQPETPMAELFRQAIHAGETANAATRALRALDARNAARGTTDVAGSAPTYNEPAETNSSPSPETWIPGAGIQVDENSAVEAVARAIVDARGTRRGYRQSLGDGYPAWVDGRRNDENLRADSRAAVDALTAAGWGPNPVPRPRAMEAEAMPEPPDGSIVFGKFRDHHSAGEVWRRDDREGHFDPCHESKRWWWHDAGCWVSWSRVLRRAAQKGLELHVQSKPGSPANLDEAIRVGIEAAVARYAHDPLTAAGQGALEADVIAAVRAAAPILQAELDQLRADAWVAEQRLGDHKAMLDGYEVVDPRDMAALRALIRSTELFGTGYRWTPRGRDPMILHPTEVEVFTTGEPTPNEVALAEAQRTIERLTVERDEAKAILAEIRGEDADPGVIMLYDGAIAERDDLRSRLAAYERLETASRALADGWSGELTARHAGLVNAWLRAVRELPARPEGETGPFDHITPVTGRREPSPTTITLDNSDGVPKPDGETEANPT